MRRQFCFHPPSPFKAGPSSAGVGVDPAQPSPNGLFALLSARLHCASFLVIDCSSWCGHACLCRSLLKQSTHSGGDFHFEHGMLACSLTSPVLMAIARNRGIRLYIDRIMRICMMWNMDHTTCERSADGATSAESLDDERTTRIPAATTCERTTGPRPGVALICGLCALVRLCRKQIVPRADCDIAIPMSMLHVGSAV